MYKDLLICKAKDMNNKWVEGYYISYKGIDYIIPINDNKTTINHIEIDFNTISNNTNNFDKNGKLVYENDLVCFSENPLDNVINLYKIEQNSLGLIATNVDNNKKLSFYYLLEVYDCEIIGNIYD